MEKALKLALLAAALRIIVAPFFAHIWDVATIQETMFYTLSGENVYKLVYALSEKVQESTGLQTLFYEGYAYLPHLIPIIFPFYALYLLIGGDPRPIKGVEGSLAVSLYYEVNFHMSKDIFLFLSIVKLPMIIADSLIVYILYRTGYGKAAAIYALSPYSIFITGMWGMFDSIVALCLLLTLIFLNRQKHALAGLLYGFSLVKIYAAILLPAILVYLLRRGKRQLIMFLAGFTVSQAPTLLFALLDFKSMLYSVLLVHIFRQPSGLTPLRVLNLAENVEVSIAVGMAHAAVSMLVYTALLYVLVKHRVDMWNAFTILLLYFLAFSKVVHEQYYLSLYPLMLLKDEGRARVLEALFLVYGAVNVGVFLLAPVALFIVDYRYVKLHSSIVYSDLGLLVVNVVGPMLMFALSVTAFMVIVKILLNSLRSSLTLSRQ